MGNNYEEPVSEFIAFCHSNNLSLFGDIVFDGEVRRFPVEGDTEGKKSGWYVLHESLNGFYGVIGNWKTGKSFNWKSGIKHKIVDLVDYKNKKEKEIAESIRKKELAATESNKIWINSKSVSPEHAYILDKKIVPYNCRQNGRSLVIPIWNIAGELRSLQFIGQDKRKMFMKNGEKKGNYWSVRGGSECYIGHYIALCEGYATACTIRTLTGLPVVASMDAGNMIHVAANITEKYPHATLAIFADNDLNSAKNTGIEAANSVNNEFGGTVLIPEFDWRNTKCSDWNDYFIVYGKDKARERIFSILDV